MVTTTVWLRIFAPHLPWEFVAVTAGGGGGAAWTTSNQPYTTKQAMVMGQRCRCVIHWHAVGDKIYGYTDR